MSEPACLPGTMCIEGRRYYEIGRVHMMLARACKFCVRAAPPISRIQKLQYVTRFVTTRHNGAYKICNTMHYKNLVQKTHFMKNLQ